MSSTKPSSQDRTPQDPPAAAEQQEHAGHSGEGAASALAQLKTQAQRRRELNDQHRPGGERPQ